MAVATVDVAAFKLVQDATAAWKSKDLSEALRMARKGAEEYPLFQVPGRNDSVPIFGQMVAALSAALGTPEPAPVQEKAPEPAPAPEPEPAPVRTAVLRLVHDGQAPTALFGVEKDTPAQKIAGRKASGGQGWRWDPARNAFYLPGSGGFALRQAEVDALVHRLEAERSGGVPLYRVEKSVEVNGVDGKPLPVWVSRQEKQEQARQWQLRYNGALNSARWNLSMGQGECVSCPMRGLTESTGRIARDGEKIPQVQCVNCTGEASAAGASAALMSDLMALTAEPSPVPESAECPSCRTRQRVVDGKLVPHSRPYVGSACRGKLGVARVRDVEAEPAPVKASARKATAVQGSAPEAVTVPELQERLVAALAAGDDASGILAQMAALLVPVKAEPAPEPVKAEPVKAEPVKAEPVLTSIAGKSWVFKTPKGTSGTALKATATAVRVALMGVHARVKGLDVEVRRDRDAKTLSVTVVAEPDGGVADAKALLREIQETVLATQGVVGRKSA